MTLQKEESDFENVFPENGFDNKNTSNKKSKKRKLEDIPLTEPQTRKLKNDLYKPPTVEELNNLKETENLYNNNLFRLQIEELIAEVNIKNKRNKELSVWVDTFESFLETLPEYEVTLSTIQNPCKTKTKGAKLISKLANYNLAFKTDQDVLIKLKKPHSMKKFGLYDLSCLPGPNAVLQIYLEMSPDCFLTKDFLNYRYYTKRFYYLLYILEHLKQKKKLQIK